jgi:hypothetical protein
MNTFFIISPALYAAADWQASPVCHVGPVLIETGAHAGSYAVNTLIFKSDLSFEAYRTLLEAQPTATAEDVGFPADVPV